MEGQKVCHSEADIALCGPHFEYVCLWSHSKDMRSSIHLVENWNLQDYAFLINGEKATQPYNSQATD